MFNRKITIELSFNMIYHGRIETKKGTGTEKRDRSK